MNLLNKSRKAFTATVVAATIAWSMGLSAMSAVAAVPATGSLIKASLPTVYYLGADNKRYVFPNAKTYSTWYADFSSVQTITDAELASIPLGGNATYRPGVRMVKITTDPKVYAVAKGGVLRWVTSEAVATALYGANWNQMIDDVPDSFFTNYTIGADINAAGDFVPASETSGSASINDDKGLASGGTTVSGTLSAMLSSSQPMGGTIPLSATGVTMVKVDVKNMGASSVTLDSMTVRRTGVGSASDFSSIYAYEGNNRLTTGRSINSSTNEATFSNLGVMLAAGETKTLWVSADVNSGTAGNENALQIVSVMSGSTSVAGLPLAGPTYKWGGSSVGSLTIDKNGTLANITAGSTGSKVAEFKLTAGSTEDVVLHKVSLYYAGLTSRSNLTNLVLKQGGNTLASVSGIASNDLVTFVLSSPMTLAKGTNRIFEVYADLNGSARAESSTGDIKFYVDQTTDVYGVGATYGYGVTVTNSTYDGSSSGTKYSIAEIEAGQLTATFNGPAAKEVSRDSDNVELFNYTLSAQANLEIRETNIAVTTTTDNVTVVDNLKIVDAATGAIIAGPYDMTTAGTSETKAFTEVYNLTAGQSRTFKVVADISNDASNGATVKVTLGSTTLFGSNKVRNLDTSTYLTSTDMVPSGVIAGNAHTVRVPSLTTTLASTPVSQTFIQGSQGVDLFGFNMKAGEASDVRVSQIVLTGYTVASISGTFTKGADGTATLAGIVLTAGLYNGSTQVGETKSPTTGDGGVLTFNNLNLTIPAGQTITLMLKGNLASSISSVSSTVSNRVKFDFADGPDAGVTATDADGNTITDATTAAINGTTANSGTRMTVANAGTVSLVKAGDDTESAAGLVVAGSSNVVLAKYKISASNEELKLTKVRLTTSTATAVSSLSLYDGSTLVGGPVGVNGSGVADFTGLNFVIPKDGYKTLVVKGNLNDVGPSGATTASDVAVTLDYNDNFEIRGTSSGSSTQLTCFSGTGSSCSGGADVAGNAKIIRRSKPTVSLVTLPSTTLTNGDKTVLRFTVSADAAGDVSLYKLSAEVIESGSVSFATLAGSSSVKVVGSDYIPGSSTLSATNGTATFVATFSSEVVIAAGTSKTFDVILTLAGVASSGDSVVARLLGDDTAGAAAVAASVSGNFAWSDLSSASHSLTTADWTNGYKVNTLPSDSQTMTK